MTPYYERDGITIYCGDCPSVIRDLLPDNHIDLTVTSPPYDLVDENMITHSENGLRDYQGYEWDFVSVAKQLYRVTAKGGVVVWVVGDQTIDGSETGSSFRQALYFMGLGFKLHDTMIYEKNYSLPQTLVGRYTQVFEYMFILSKENPNCNYIHIPCLTFQKRQRQDKGQRWSNGVHRKREISDKPVKETKIKTNVWQFDPKNDTSDKLAFTHPARFPEALARDHIISWSNPGDLILDPFLGSGTTLKMAQQLGRRAIGIDISEEYCAIAVDRLRQPSFFSIPDKPKAKPAEQLSLSLK